MQRGRRSDLTHGTPLQRHSRTCRIARPDRARVDAMSRRTRSSSSIPRHMVRNPVMFVVLVGSVLTTRRLGVRRRRPAGATCGFTLPDRALALVHRAVRQLRRSDGRGARQGAGRRAARARRHADAAPSGSTTPQATIASSGRCPPPSSATGDLVLVEAGDLIPGDGEVIEGVASVDESGDHRRERARSSASRGGDRSRRHRRHPGALRLDRRPDHRQPGRDLPRPHDRAGRGRAAAEDAERDRAHHPARRR